MKARLPVLCALALSGCATVRVPGSWRMPERALCDGSYVMRALDAPRLADLPELSGLATSPSNPDVVWTHNDSGNAPRLHAFASDGAPLGSLRLAGVKASDLEDLAAGPCPDRSGPCLWVADTGDNGRRRSSVSVHAIPEPSVSRERPLEDGARSEAGWRFVVRYPGGPVDVEALFVLPDASAFYLIEKTDAPRARVFRRETARGASQLVREVGRLAVPGPAVPLARQVTAADLHPSGLALVVRTYSGLAEYRLAGLDALERLDLLAPSKVETIGPLAEPQGEAIAYDGSGRGLWTVSEDPLGRGEVPLHPHGCE